MFEAIFYGLALGIMHVVGGVDHLIAMTPSSFSSPKDSLKNGFSWGVGHSLGVIILTFIASFINNNESQIQKFSSFAEFFVGVSLLMIGFLAIKNSIGLSIHSHNHHHKNGIAHKHFHMHGLKKNNHNKHPHAITTLGLLHGLAGGHIFAPLGAFALAANRSDFTFFHSLTLLIGYLIGSLVIMNLFTVLISIFSVKVGKKLIKRFIAFIGSLSLVFGGFLIRQSVTILVG